MTGFGVGEVALSGGRVVAEIRSVNHRFLEVRARLPRELADLTLFAEQVARERLRRGRFELAVRTEGAVLAPAILDLPRARAAIRALGELRDELAPGSDLPLSLLAAVPDLFVPPGGPELDAVRAALATAIERSVAALQGMADREGSALAADLLGRSRALRRHRAALTAQADGASEVIRRRMRERVDRLLLGGEIVVDATRLEVEVTLLADRSDVTEELTRLLSHLDQFEGIIAGDGAAPVGRRLDFLLQEMVREVNTLGAKAQDAAISHEVVAMKVELERMREQVQNVE